MMRAPLLLAWSRARYARLRMSRGLWLAGSALILAELGWVEGCGSDNQQGVGGSMVASVIVTPGTASIAINQQIEIVAQARNAGGSAVQASQVTWKSSDPATATLGAAPSGDPTHELVTAVALGVVKIAATIDGKSDTAVVTISATPPPPGVVVSDPVSASALISPRIAGRGRVTGRIATASPGTTDAWVSMEPGAIPDGNQVTIRNARLGSTLTSPMTAGGFDPLAVEAFSGDNLDLEIRRSGGASLHLPYVVPPRLSPRVVRCYPPHKKRDVALNVGILTVFSEPVSLATLSTSSVQLLRGTTPVPGTVTLLTGTATTAIFTPTTQLSPSTDYHLVVNQTIKDLSGDSLEAGLTADFTTGTTVVGAVTAVFVQPRTDSVTVPVGASAQFTATATDALGNVVEGRPTTWSSSNPGVATVSPTGVVTTLAEGFAQITATVDGVSGNVGLSVSAALQPVGSVKVSLDSTRVSVGATFSLSVQLLDTAGRTAWNRLVSWTTSDAAVASVTNQFSSNYAIVTAVGPGDAIIRATVEGKSDSALVSVGPPLPLASLSLTPNPVSTVLQVRVPLQLNGRDTRGFLDTIPGSSATWSSSFPAVASVDGSGAVTALAAGSTKITASYFAFQTTADVTVASLAFGAVSVGGFQSCGVIPSGAGYCWGFAPAPAVAGSTPTPVPGGHTFAAISTGVGFLACGLASGGGVFCWGNNEYGQLGDGTTTPSGSPIAVSGGSNLVTVTEGEYHACGLTSSGQAYCWGNGTNGQLGQGANTDSRTPVPVAGGHSFNTIGAGSGFTCGLTSAGAAYCWGNSFFGQLGYGDTLTTGNTPQPVSTGVSFRWLTVGYQHACGLTSAGVAYCWGRNDSGQLGAPPSRSSSVPLLVSTPLRFTSLSAGNQHTCGLTSGGGAYCWGGNTYGALGSGTTTDSYTPVLVSGGHAFASIGAGIAFSFTCAVTTSQVAYCWGDNSYGVLGTTSSLSSTVPVKVAGQP